MTASIESITPMPKRQPARKKQAPHICPDGRMNEAAAAEYLGCSTSKLRSDRTAGKGPTYIDIGRIWYRKDDLNLYLDEHTVDPIGN